MLTVRTFASIDEAATAMGLRTRYLGGGTLVMRAVNEGDQSFDTIVRTADPSLKAIRSEGARIVVGAAVTMAEVLASRELEFLWPVARVVGGPAVRTMATVGGNLLAPHPYGDFATALLALEAVVRVVGRGDQPIEAFLAGREGGSGLVASVSVPRPTGDEFRFQKVSRVKPKGVSVMSLAAWLPRRGGRIVGARIAFGAMGPRPLRAKAAETALEGSALDAQGAARASERAGDGLEPADDALASAWYRREVAPVHLRRLLLGQGGW